MPEKDSGKKVDWSKWPKPLTDIEQEIIEFCDRCDYLGPSDYYLEPLCLLPGSTAGQQSCLILGIGRCPYAKIRGVNGTIHRGIFTPRQKPAVGTEGFEPPASSM